MKGKPRNQNRIKELGFKYNMTNISAVMGLEQLKTFKSKLKKYQFNGSRLEIRKNTTYKSLKLANNVILEI